MVEGNAARTMSCLMLVQPLQELGPPLALDQSRSAARIMARLKWKTTERKT